MFAFLGLRDDVEIDVSHRANVAAEYSSKTAARLVNRPTRMKTLAKRVLPAKLTRGIRNRLEKHFRRSIQSHEKPPLTDAVVTMLRQRYRDDVTELERLLDRDLSHWKQSPG